MSGNLNTSALRRVLRKDGMARKLCPSGDDIVGPWINCMLLERWSGAVWRIPQIRYSDLFAKQYVLDRLTNTSQKTPTLAKLSWELSRKDKTILLFIKELKKDGELPEDFEIVK